MWLCALPSLCHLSAKATELVQRLPESCSENTIEIGTAHPGHFALSSQHQHKMFDLIDSTEGECLNSSLR